MVHYAHSWSLLVIVRSFCFTIQCIFAASGLRKIVHYNLHIQPAFLDHSVLQSRSLAVDWPQIDNYVRMTCLSLALGVFLSMWTQGQVHVLNIGLSIELDCEFYAEDFNMFNNPVIWKKYQRQEQADVNIMGNILPPFFATGRFQVTLTSTPPRYRLRLKVIGTHIIFLFGVTTLWTQLGWYPEQTVVILKI